MSSAKIFRPWDGQEHLDNKMKKRESSPELDVTQVSNQIIADRTYSTGLNLHQCCDQINSKLINKSENTSLPTTPNDEYHSDKAYFNVIENYSPRQYDVRESEKHSNLSDHQKNNQLSNDKDRTYKNIRDSDKHIEMYSRTKSPCNNVQSEANSLQSNGHAKPSDSSRLHRRHSRKHRSKPSQEPHHITRSNTSSPNNSTLDTTLLSQEKTSELSQFEKHFYPDYRSLEFLPEDILDPILMSGLPLGAPLDPYWSNLALEYFKSHEQTLRAKQQRPKKFNCPHCNVAFSNNGQLKGHIRIHTGERPFKCEAEGCGKSFTRNEELTRHKRIHSGLRPYPCTHCGKKFGRKDHLKKHLRTHFPQPRYVPVYPYMYAGGYTTVIM